MTIRPPPIPKPENTRIARRRHREGTMALRIGLRPLMRDLLLDRGHLQEWDESDPRKVAEALDDYHREVSGDMARDDISS